MSVWMQQKKRYMDYKKHIEQYLENSGGIITASYCRSKKIPTIYLSRLVREGILQRAAEGLYISEAGMYDAYYYFQYRFKKAVFSYETALHLLGATDKIPQDMDVTVYYSYKFNKAPLGVNIHYVNKKIHNLGVVETRTMFNTLSEFIHMNEHFAISSPTKMQWIGRCISSLSVLMHTMPKEISTLSMK